MSENLKLVQSILTNWERGDFGSVDWADPRIEYAIVDDPGSRMARGVAAMKRTWGEFLTVWDDYRVEARRYCELDEERVLVRLRAHGRERRADWTSTLREAVARAQTSSTYAAAR